MKYVYRLFLVVVFGMQVGGVFGQEHQFDWAVGMGGSGFDDGKSITTDAQGNIYTTGHFVGTVDFDPSTAIFNLSSNGGGVFIQKLDSNGNFLWAKNMGGYASGQSITTDALGSIYTTGSFQGAVDFDPSTATFYLFSNGGSDIFIQKLDSNGNFLWAKNMGGSDYDNGQSSMTDALGNIYTTGSFRGIADFDPSTATFNLSSNNGSYDIFIQKLDSNGNFLWAKKMGAYSNVDDYGQSITTDALGNIYTTGYFKGNVDFDPSTATFNLYSNGDYDIFIQKLDSNGNFLWAKSMGASNNDRGNSITTDAIGNIYTTGYFVGTVDFDPSTAIFNLSSNGGLDIFIQKLDSNGNFLWAKNMGGSGFDDGKSITTDAQGNIYTTGRFQGTADFDLNPATFYLFSNGNTDIFIQKLDSNGNFLWAKNMGGYNYDNGQSITTDALGNIYTTGYFQDTTDFDPSINTFILSSNGSPDIFIQKLRGPLANDIGLSNILPFCSNTSVSVDITNFGYSTIDSFTINWSVNDTLQPSILHYTSIMPNQTQSVSLNNYPFSTGQPYTIKAWTSNPNNLIDDDINNDTLIITSTSALNGTYTVGGTSPDYSTLTAAVNDLNTVGICGSVVFNLRDTIFNEQIIINEIAGVDSINTITFQSENSDSTQVIIQSILVQHTDNIIKLNGTDWITFKGITIQSDANNGYSRLVDITNEANHITFESCIFIGRNINSTSTYYTALYSGNTSDNYITIKNNKFYNGAYGIYFNGTSTSLLEEGLIIENNQFTNQYYKGIYTRYQKGIYINQNRLITPSSYNYSTGIECYYCDEGCIISNNFINGHKGYGIYSYYSDGTITLPNKIFNNFINLSDGGVGYGGIYINQGSYIDVTYNTVKNNNTSSSSYALYETGGSNKNYSNNVLYSEGGYAAYFSSVSSFLSDYNSFYTSGSNLIRRNSSNYTLSSWQSFSGNETNSVNTNPNFLSPNSYQVNNTLLDSAATSLSYITTDIEGNIRNATHPDIGAYEFTAANVILNIDTSICYGDTLYIGNDYYTITGNYTTSNYGNNGQDTIALLDLNVFLLNSVNIAESICYGDTSYIGSEVFDTSGIYIRTLQTWKGCDSLVTLNLTVNPTQSAILNETICQGQSYMVGNANYISSGTYLDTLQAFNGCDSIVTLNLTILPMSTTTVDTTICQGHFVIFDNITYSQSGNFSKTLTNYHGCDSIINLNLTVIPNITITVLDTLCQGDSLIIGGSIYKEDGTYTIVLSTYNGCDSIINLQLNSNSMSGTYTVGGTNPDYSTITAAVNDLHSYGICGPVIFNLRDTIFNEQITINEITGAGSINTITFQSESGDSTEVIISSYLAQGTDNIITLDGADWITFKAIKIQSEWNNGYSRLVDMKNGANHITFESCIFTGRNINSTSTFYALLYSGSTSDGFLTIKNNKFYSGTYGVYLNGQNNSILEEALIIKDNYLSNQRFKGLYIRNQKGLNISNNELISPNSSTNGIGIDCYYCDEGSIISSNSIIGYEGYGIYAYRSDGTFSSPNKIYNNYINLYDGGVGYGGIYINQGSYIDVIHNTVHNKNTNSNSYALYETGTGSNKSYYNNIFYSEGGRAAYYGSTSSFQSDNNSFYTGGSNLIRRSNSNYTLSGWQSYSGKETNSVNTNPNFPILNSYETVNPLLDSAAQPIAYISTDIEGNVRNATHPDIGAYEFDLASVVLNQNATICGGDTVFIGNEFFTTTGTHITAPFGSSGQDTIIVLNISFYFSPYSFKGETICEGQSYTLNNQTFTETGNYTIVYPTSTYINGCDSFVFLNLTVLAKTTIFASAINICLGDAITLYANNGTTFQWSNGSTNQFNTFTPNTAGIQIYSVTTTNSQGCTFTDSITINIENNLPDAVTFMTPANGGTLIQPNSVFWNNTNYTDYYNLYFWIDGFPMPTNPTYSNITDFNFALNGLEEGLYNWVVEGVNTCGSTMGTVQQVAIFQRPDFYVDSINYTLLGGNTIFVNWFVGNLGGTGTNGVSWSDGVYLSLDGTLSSNDIFLGNASNNGNSIGNGYTQSGTFTIPNGIGGNFQIIIAVNNTNTVLEISTSNNNGNTGSGSGGGSGGSGGGTVTIPNNPSFSSSLDSVNICQGDTILLSATGGVGGYQWSPALGLSQVNTATVYAFPTQNSSYIVTSLDANGLVVNDTIKIIVKPNPMISVSGDTAICEDGMAQLQVSGGYSYQWLPSNGLNNRFIANPIATPTITTTYTVQATDVSTGCFSVEDIIVTVMDVPDLELYSTDTTICANTSALLSSYSNFPVLWSSGYTLNDSTLYNPIAFPTDTITYYISSLNTNNGICLAQDSVTVSVFPIPNIQVSNDTTICLGENVMLQVSGGVSYEWSNINSLDNHLIANPIATPTATHNYSVIVTDSNSCEFLDSVLVTLNPTQQTIIDTIICDNEAMTAGNISHNITGNYTYVLQTWQGCDSTVILNLTVNPTQITTIDTVICSNEIMTAGGVSHNITGNYTYVLQTWQGCDSTVILNLTVNPTQLTVIDSTICQGEYVFAGGFVYVFSGTYSHVLQTWQGCDSTVILNLLVNPTNFINQNFTICQGENIPVGANNYTTTGIYTDTLMNVYGCDSIVTTDLLVNPTHLTNQNLTICQGESIAVGTFIHNTTGIFTDTLMNIYGCDSIIITDLTVNPTYLINQNFTICQGDSISVGTFIYNTTGIFTDTLMNVYGCDSIIITDLTVNPTHLINQNLTICQGESITVGIFIHNTAGIFTDTLMSVYGCDSIVITDLTVNPTHLTNQNFTICQGDSIVVGTFNHNTTGIFTDTLMNVYGCDSIIITDLTVNPIQTTMLTDTICHYETLDFNGQVLDSSGTYQSILQDTNGCDSTVVLTLIVQPATTILDTLIIDGTGIPLGAIDITPSGDTLTQQYFWSTGSTSQDIFGLGTGLYTLAISDAVGCVDTFSFEIGAVTTHYIKNEVFTLPAYPNPIRAGQYLTIEFQISSNEKVHYEFIDLLGREISDGFIDNPIGRQQIIVPPVAGTYLLRLSKDDVILKSSTIIVF